MMAINSRVSANVTNVVWSYVLVRYYGSGVVQSSCRHNSQYDRVPRYELDMVAADVQVVSSQYRWDVMRLYNADYKAMGVQG
jgi:hypothetical protein